MPPSTMAKPLCNFHPPLLSSFRHKQPLITITPRELRHFTSATRTTTLNPRLSLSTHSSNSTRFHFSPPKSTSVNGYATTEEYKNGAEEADVQLSEKLRQLFAFLRSILPGGTWWSFSDEADIRIFAKPVTVARALTRMWGLVARDRWVIFAAFSALIVAAYTELFGIAAAAASAFGDIHTALLDSVNIHGAERRSRGVPSKCAAVGASLCCFGNLQVKRMRETLYSSLLVQDIFFFDTETVGDLTSRLGADCQQVSRVIGNDLNMIFRNVLQGTGAMIYLLVLSRPLGLCVLAICSTLAAIMLIYGRYQKKAAKLTQEFTASANEVAQETFSLVRTVRVYGTEEQELGRYKLWLGKLADISVRQSAASGFWNLSFNALYHSTQVIAVLIGGMSILAGHITAEKLTKFILYSEWLIYSTWWVGDNLSSLMQSVGASEKVFQLMDLLPRSKLQRLVGHVEFVNVSFHYPTRPTVSVLQNVSLLVKPNEVVAIVGLSGSGKSTLVNLLLRLYEPTNGQILIDGFPLQDLDVMWWRERIGFVGQEPKLFRMDISSNIRYGCTRDITQEDVEWAAKQAYAHDFILSLPNGYHTLVDDDLLSGGQKQRIAIARAILRDPTVLILDEATSALDAESEHNVKGALRAVRSDKTTRRTVIIIAHRLSTIQAADRIVVMDAGRIVETGSHRELLVDGGLYARLTRRQADAVA
ncbi:hypothetical protein DVH24_040913 [Malus domestica]|uniref:ABC transporter B family member 26, chloroplastic n=1 Tax=Malus domestica TaxID=3750 RepID=A0A498I8J6_MALDO|nr:hypothetical protein DVH24_040913 [Malus domestica]